MKRKFSKIFIGALITLFVGYLLVTGISDLTNKKDLHTLNLDYAIEILEVENSINGIIPYGTDYYYLAAEIGTNNAYIIHAPKNWLDKNFDKNNMSKNPDGVHITALSKRVSDYDISKELNSRVMKIDGITYPLGTEYCLELSYKTDAIMKLVLLAISVVLAIAGLVVYKSGKEINKKLSIVYVIAIVVVMILILLVLR